MVKEAVRCEHCAQTTHHPVTAVVEGRTLNFCCVGCQNVYAYLVEEGLLHLVQEANSPPDHKKED